MRKLTCLNRSTFGNLYQSDVYVSYTSKFIDSPTVLFLPPTTTRRVPIKRVLCWYLSAGRREELRYGAFIQSSLLSLCFRKPHVSLMGCPSAPLPPNMTIIPFAVPVLQILALWYARGGGFYIPVSTFFHYVVPRISLTHTSPIGSLPVLPPWMIRYGRRYPITCP